MGIALGKSSRQRLFFGETSTVPEQRRPCEQCVCVFFFSFPKLFDMIILWYY